ncbi:carboxylesterase [Coniochaeta ligniaria NRRL 30616]|uniref:Carboxylic ester hydrolase n=1 Tax=Coniochaeta ligniaria NRRL 30616 TaxID=1408157 RepID=A0A1J7J5V4_9PEZI|nr:carboxylesterase [Coniochaeta ligniaria NRRL 30616]
MLTSLARTLCVISSLLLPLVAAQDLVASLDYGTFQGAYSSKYNISYWQKIPFAAPPVGQNRFAGPKPPEPITNGTYDSSQPFDMCPQRTVNGSEDCLYLGLYSRPWTKGQPLRPVVVVFYGGGFIQGSAYFTLPPSAYPILNVSDTSDIVFIYPNYRTNAFGLLAGAEVLNDEHSDTNAGLLDQRAAISWANRYAAQFGGDPEDVSIWGQSAGGGSVVAQVIADQDFDGRTGARFTKALASSPYWAKTYDADGPEAQWNYDTLVNGTGCAGAEDTLACLKGLDVQTIRDASLYITATHVYNTSSYTWAPVIDGKFLPRRLTQAVGEGRVNARVGFGMYNTHEGETFIPGGLGGAKDSGSPPFNSSDASFEKWLGGFLPGLRKCELEAVKRYYPKNGSSEGIPSYEGWYTAAGLIYRDVVLACPAYWMAGAQPKGSWLGEYSIAPAKHASDTYWWNTVNAAQQTDPFHYHGYTGAFASFFVTGDPNKLKLTNSSVPGVPDLDTGKEFNINAEGFANVDITQLEKRCGLWKKLAPRIPI